jgi:GxxExxY protein
LKKLVEKKIMDLIYKEEFYKVKQTCIKVRKTLGNGFLEKVYENALVIELRKSGFNVEAQKELLVKYDNKIVGQYFADIVIDNKIIIELKTVSKLTEINKLQILNYLKATGYELGILINFPNEAKGFEIMRVPNFIDK